MLPYSAFNTKYTPSSQQDEDRRSSPKILWWKEPHRSVSVLTTHLRCRILWTSLTKFSNIPCVEKHWQIMRCELIQQIDTVVGAGVVKTFMSGPDCSPVKAAVTLENRGAVGQEEKYYKKRALSYLRQLILRGLNRSAEVVGLPRCA